MICFLFVVICITLFAPQVTVYHLLKLFQSDPDIMLGKKSLVVEYYDEMVRTQCSAVR